MSDRRKSGCHGCRYADWDAEGCYCKLFGENFYDTMRGCQNRKDYPISNGDRIRAMTNDELARYMDAVARCCRCSNCKDCPLNDAGEFCTVDELSEYFGKEV